MRYPIETPNVILIILGIALIISAPIILYFTISGVVKRRKIDPKAKLHVISNGFNIIIAVLFLGAGILFIINNLRGNPLSY